MHNTAALGTLMAYSHHHYSSPERFHHPKLKACASYMLLPCLFLHQILVTTALLFVSMNWTLLGTSYKEGDGTPLQYSCLGNPMDGGAW